MTSLRDSAIINFDANNSNEVAFNDQIIRIHSLTQGFLESHQTSQDVSQQLEKIAGVFIQDLETCRDNALPQNGKMWMNHFNKICEFDSKKAILLSCFVVEEHQHFLHDLFLTRGNHLKLQEYFEYICEHQRKLLGENDSVFLRTRSRLAEILFETSQKEKSLVIIKDTMKLQLEVVGPLHIDYLFSKSILAFLTDDYSECYRMCMELKDSLNKTNNKHSILSLIHI